jgi:hypothetical protein
MLEELYLEKSLDEITWDVDALWEYKCEIKVTL